MAKKLVKTTNIQFIKKLEGNLNFWIWNLPINISIYDGGFLNHRVQFLLKVIATLFF